MSSPVSLFKAAVVVVDPKKRQSPLRGPYPEIRKEPPSRPRPKAQPATSISSLPLPLPASAMEAAFTSPAEVILLSCIRTRQVSTSVGCPCRAPC